MKYGFLFILFCLSIHGYAKEYQWQQQAPGGFSIVVDISETKISLLDTLKIVVTATFPADYTINWNELKSHLLFNAGFIDTAFQLAGETIMPMATDANGTVSQKGIFELTPLVTGKHTLTFLNIPFDPKDPHQHQPVKILSALFDVDISIPSVDIDQPPMPAPLLTFKEEYPIDANSANKRQLEQLTGAERNAKIFKEREIPWIGILALAAAFALLLTAKKSIPKPATVPLLSNQEQALIDLQEARGLLRQEAYDSFYTTLTRTLRHYIEITYNIPADAKTTEEFLKNMAEHPIFAKETQEALKSFLHNADRVKYGHLPTTKEDADEAYRLAEKLIML